MKRLKRFGRAWKYALGSFNDRKTKKYDNSVATIRTLILLAYLITNGFIIAGVIRHWNKPSSPTPSTLLLKTMEPTTQSPTTTSFQIEPDEVVYDEAFVVRESRFGLFNSTTVEGRKMITGLTKETVITMTRWYLKCEQEGWPEGSVCVVNNGVVGGKL